MKRNYGIDLCRIVVMFMVATHHILSHGWIYIGTVFLISDCCNMVY